MVSKILTISIRIREAKQGFEQINNKIQNVPKGRKDSGEKNFGSTFFYITAEIICCLNLIETGAMDTDDSHTQKHVYLPAADDHAWGYKDRQGVLFERMVWVILILLL